MRRAAGLACVVMLSGCGSGGAQKVPGGDPFQEVRRDAQRPAVARASPRWERVAVLSGEGRAAPSVSIARGAIQWRARWRCTRGALTLADADRRRLIQSRCPGRGVGTAAATTGRRQLDVRAGGAWSLAVEQQVDTPLREPPLPAMAAAGARVLATGAFYGIERRGGGSVTLHRLAGGRLALRLEAFDTSPNSDLFVWVSRAARPRTTRAAFDAEHVSVAPLAATLGDQNYLLPASVRARDVRSIVIWCEPVRIAYAAAALRRR